MQTVSLRYHRVVSRRSAWACAIAFSASWHAGAAFGQDEPAQRAASFAVGAIVERTDNVTRAATDEVSDTIVGAITDFGLSRDTRRLSLSLEGNLAYYNYATDIYDTEVVGSAAVAVDTQIVPQRVSWLVQDTFGQARVDELAPVTADNRQNVNVFMTGPRFIAPLGSRTSLTLEGFYAVTNYEDSLEDNDSTQTRLSAARRITPRQTLSINGGVQNIDYDEDALFLDYDEQEYYLGWAAEGARTRLNAEVGRSRIDGFEPGEDSTDGSLARLEIDRDVGSRGTLTLRARKEMSSSAEAFRLSRQLLGVSLQTDRTLVTSDPFELRYAGISYAVDGRSLTMVFDVARQEDRYEVRLDQDRDGEWADLAVLLRIGTSWSTGVFWQYGEETYINRDDARFDLTSAGVLIGMNLASQLRLDFVLAREERDADFESGGYEDNFARLVVAYWVGDREPRRLTMPRSR